MKNRKNAKNNNSNNKNTKRVTLFNSPIRVHIVVIKLFRYKEITK